jgi:hypothetical protein
MRQSWLLVVVTLFLLAAGAAERLSALYVRHLADTDERLARRADEMKARADGAAVESKKYQEIDHLASLIEDQVRWEPDSTRVMRSFADIAARLGVRLVETRALELEGMGREGNLVAGGAFQRMRIEAHLVGSFWGLLQYVDAVEHSAQPMVVENLNMTADRDKIGTGDVRMTVSALFPVPSVAGSSATTVEAK